MATRKVIVEMQIDPVFYGRADTDQAAAETGLEILLGGADLPENEANGEPVVSVICGTHKIDQL